MKSTFLRFIGYLSVLSLISVVLFACQGQASGGAQGEVIELPSLSHTIYTEQTELFAEFRTLIAGDSVKLAGHFTRLGTLFTAVSEGSITLQFTVSGATVTQEANVSSSPGIFRYAFVPPKPGMGRMVFNIRNKTYTDQIMIDSVIVFPDLASAMAAPEPKEPEGGITYLKESAWKTQFTTTALTPQPFTEVVRTAGEILPAQGAEMVVTANAGGIVSFSGARTVEGAAVSAGDALFTISGGSLTDGNTETRFAQTKASYDKAKADFDRAQELIKDSIISRKEFQAAKAHFETEEAAYTSLSRNYQGGAQKVAAPISGYIKTILVSEGEFVSIGQPLAQVLQNRLLLLKAEVSQKYFSKLPFIVSANFRTAYSDTTYALENLNGRLVAYGKGHDAGEPFIPVTFSFNNQGAIIPGTLVEVFLKLKPAVNALSIPHSALTEEQGVHYAYVQTSGETFAKRELTLGGSDGINIRVLSGLRNGDRVVTQGAYQIKLASMSGTIPVHGHAH